MFHSTPTRRWDEDEDGYGYHSLSHIHAHSSFLIIIDRISTFFPFFGVTSRLPTVSISILLRFVYPLQTGALLRLHFQLILMMFRNSNQRYRPSICRNKMQYFKFLSSLLLLLLLLPLCYLCSGHTDSSILFSLFHENHCIEFDRNGLVQRFGYLALKMASKLIFVEKIHRSFFSSHFIYTQN